MGGIPGANGLVRAAAVDSSGNLYIGGEFTIAGDLFAKNVAKWNGSSWTPLGSGVGRGVYAFAISGSDLYVGGDFTTAGGSAANYIAKWNGIDWTALGSGIGPVYALAISGTNVYAAGYGFVSRWNGSSWEAMGLGASHFVRALVSSGSNVYAGGSFWSAGDSPALAIASWSERQRLGSSGLGD